VRFKIVPEPPAEGGTYDGESESEGDDPIERATRAIPLVPAAEDECCARLMNRLGLAARDAAREWLTFLRALGLVVETESGFSRSRDERAFAELATTFRERVYGVREVLCILDVANEPLSADAVAEEFAEHVPQWERFRYPDPKRVWGERVNRILDWAVYFGLSERVGDRYQRVDGSLA